MRALLLRHCARSPGVAAALALLLLLGGCDTRKNAVSGTIEVDEAHVGPRSGGRVEKILAWEGDRLHEGQVIVQLDASELRARRDLASAQIDTALHDADAQEAQLEFLRDEHVRVRVDSFPHTDFDGVVEQINRQAEFTPRNVQTVADRIKQVFGVKVRLPSDDDRLRAGMAADVYFSNVK